MERDILEVKNLSKIYSNKHEQTGIFELNFNVKKGSFHAFIGENGAGKTTTIKTIIGAYMNYTGEVYINQINIKDHKSRLALGYIPENAIFPKELTVVEYLTYLGQLNGIEKSELILKIDSYLEEFEISALKFKKPFNFSSGQKKKVLLIQALLNNPQIIILDEPAANLDPTARYQLFSLLKNLHQKGITIFISSHILSEIDKFVDSLTLIHKGKIVYSGQRYTSLENIFYDKVIKA